jgi:hypothetical protein
MEFELLGDDEVQSMRCWIEEDDEGKKKMGGG